MSLNPFCSNSLTSSLNRIRNLHFFTELIWQQRADQSPMLARRDGKGNGEDVIVTDTRDRGKREGVLKDEGGGMKDEIGKTSGET